MKKPGLQTSKSPAWSDDATAIDRNAPLRLARAAEIAFPGGGMTASGLRREAARGRLTIERVAGKDYVTLAEIDAMRQRCRREATKQSPDTDGFRVPRSLPGRSETVDTDIALAAALLSVNKLSEPSPPTSPKRTGRSAK
jgi:hypothetical protein